MTDIGLFDWLVEYHCRRNLGACLPHVVDGRVIPPNKGAFLREGLDENELYKGLLIVSNGSTLVDRLFEDRIVLDEEIEGFVGIRSKEDFFRYMDGQENSDGAYVFDNSEQRITRVYELNNNPAKLPRKVVLLSRIPSDFSSYNGNVFARRNIGTKTRLAIKLPMAYEVETFQIKRTSYTPLGLGKVTHFGEDGLIEEFFLKSDPTHRGHFIEPLYNIVGVHRTYRSENRSIVRVSERALGQI